MALNILQNIVYYLGRFFDGPVFIGYISFTLFIILYIVKNKLIDNHLIYISNSLLLIDSVINVFNLTASGLMNTDINFLYFLPTLILPLIRTGIVFWLFFKKENRYKIKRTIYFWIFDFLLTTISILFVAIAKGYKNKGIGISIKYEFKGFIFNSSIPEKLLIYIILLAISYFFFPRIYKAVGDNEISKHLIE